MCNYLDSGFIILVDEYSICIILDTEAFKIPTNESYYLSISDDTSILRHQVWVTLRHFRYEGIEECRAYFIIFC